MQRMYDRCQRVQVNRMTQKLQRARSYLFTRGRFLLWRPRANAVRSRIFILQWATALDHPQPSALSTMPARTGFSSVYRNASHRCGSSRGQE